MSARCESQDRLFNGLHFYLTTVLGAGDTHTHTRGAGGAGQAVMRAPTLSSEVLMPAGWAGKRWGEGGAGS